MPLSTKPEYPHTYNPDNSWRQLMPRDGNPASWHGGVAGMASIIQARQGLANVDGPVYRVPMGRCVACLVQFPSAALEVESIIPYDTFAGKAHGGQDLVNMRNDTSNLTFLCNVCRTSKDLEPNVIHEWIIETARLEEKGTRLSQVQVVRQGWLDLDLASAQYRRMDLNALQTVLADPHLTPKLQAAARMARIRQACRKALNDIHFLFDFNLAKEAELLAAQLEALVKLRLPAGGPRPQP